MNALICIVNDYQIFDKVIKDNDNMQGFKVFAYNNTAENIPITKRYNSFIEENTISASEDGFWCLFIHQDLGFMEDINPILDKLDKRFIYGAVGAKMYRGIYFNKKGFKQFRVVNYGKILQGNNDFNFHPYGRIVKRPKVVDSVDCCCIIVHSELIRKYSLRFDEQLSFHMYAEEFCYSAKKNHKIKTKVVQLNCFHLGKGNLNEEFQKSAQYLKDKFKIKRVPSTCPN